MPIDINEFIKILQISISPAVLISGVGLLVLSLVNRFAHTLDRARMLSHEKREADHKQERYIEEQIKILYKRTKLILTSICFALSSIFFSSVLIMVLFFTFMLGTNYILTVAGLFITSLACLIFSLIFFIFDMSLSLKAFKKEIINL